jgi:antitoxin component of MazEF toxin-antitoxin module
MGEMVEVKLRRIGTSVGVLLPKRLLKEGHFKIGEKVHVGILKTQRKELIEKAFGMAKGLGHFKREKGDMDRF